MPTYRIISELDTDSEHRAFRGTELRGEDKRLVTTVTADTLPEAVRLIHRDPNRAGDHEPRRVISVEEVRPGPSFTDEEITAALTQSEGEWTDAPRVDPEEYIEDKFSLYGGDEFIYTVNTVADALRDSGLVPGLHVSMLQDGSGMIDYSMVEIHDDARMIYLSSGCEIKHLTDDRQAAGWAGVLAIARALINASAHLH